MGEKKPVYNGYEERYATGEDLSRLFEGRYLTTGRHHSVVLGLSIPDYIWFLGIDEQKTYRIFINQFLKCLNRLLQRSVKRKCIS